MASAGCRVGNVCPVAAADALSSPLFVENCAQNDPISSSAYTMPLAEYEEVAQSGQPLQKHITDTRPFAQVRPSLKCTFVPAAPLRLRLSTRLPLCEDDARCGRWRWPLPRMPP